jgi:hypothetical protein
MINEEMIESVMRSALNSVSKKDQISLQKLRIKMQLDADKKSINCSIYKEKEYISELSWARILGMKVIFVNVIVDTIKNMLIRLSTENEIELTEINARIYAIDETGTPNIYIYNSKKPIKKIKLSDLF